MGRQLRKILRERTRQAKREERERHQAEGGGYSPTWHRKHGSWHSRELHKMHLKTWGLLRKGSGYEGGWGATWDEVQSLAQEFERLSQVIAYRKAYGVNDKQA